MVFIKNKRALLELVSVFKHDIINQFRFHSLVRLVQARAGPQLYDLKFAEDICFPKDEIFLVVQYNFSAAILWQ